MGKVKESAQRSAIVPMGDNPNRIMADRIKSQWHKIEAVMPKHMTSERFLQLTISAVNHEPKLLECDFVSLMSCVMRCSALGLEPSAVDGLGRAYILPFYNGKASKMEATFILGYKGMLELARRSCEIQSIEARAVHAGDFFEYEYGFDEKLRHIPAKGKGSAENLTHVYMIAKFKDGGHYFDVMTRDEVEEVRKSSRAGSSSPWVTHYEAMAKKTVIRRAFPFLPIGVDAQSAAVTDETDGGFTEALELEPLMASGVGVETDSDGSAGKQQITGVGSANGEAMLEQVLEQGAEREARTAVCKTCGNTVENVAPDASIQDLNQFLCCNRPDYRWA